MTALIDSAFFCAPNHFRRCCQNPHHVLSATLVPLGKGHTDMPTPRGVMHMCARHGNEPLVVSVGVRWAAVVRLRLLAESPASVLRLREHGGQKGVGV